MKKIKALISVIICIIIVSLSSVISFAVDTENANYKLLLEYGYEEDYLDNLTDTMIDKMAETIKKASDYEFVNDYEWLLSNGLPEEFINNLAESSLARIRSTIGANKILGVDYSTEAETNNNDVIVKKLSLQLVDNADSSVIGEIVCSYWEWTINKPLIREEDYISVKWNKDVFCYDSDSFYAEDYRRNNVGDKWIVSDSYTTLARASIDSLGHWTKNYGTKKQVGGFMIFSLAPTEPIDSAVNYDRNIDIEYTHETETTFTIIVFIIFVFLILSVICIIIKLRKRKKK